MNVNQNRLYTPCIRKCCLNENDVCLGCFRSIDEIMRWTQTDLSARQQILNNADQRQQQLACSTKKSKASRLKNCS